MILKDKTYDILKWITTIMLPALGTLYFALSGIWGLPFGEQIVGTITSVVTFLGVLLGISNANYKATSEQRTFNADEFLEMMDFDEVYEDEDQTNTTEE